MKSWETIKNNLITFFTEFGKDLNFVDYLLQFIFLAVTFYIVFKILKNNKGGKFIVAVVFFVILSGVTFAFSNSFSSELTLVVILMIALLIFTMFNTEIKRSLLDSNVKKNKMDSLTVSGVELIIEETIRAVQNMSKKDIGALIVLSNDNLPE